MVNGKSTARGVTVTSAAALEAFNILEAFDEGRETSADGADGTDGADGAPTGELVSGLADGFATKSVDMPGFVSLANGSLTGFGWFANGLAVAFDAAGGRERESSLDPEAESVIAP